MWNGLASFLYRSICPIIRNIISKYISGTIPQLISWWEYFQATNETNTIIYEELSSQRKSRGVTEIIICGTVTYLRDRTLAKTVSQHTAFWAYSSMAEAYTFPRLLHLEGQEMREDSRQQSCWAAVSVSLSNFTKSYKHMFMFLGSFLRFPGKCVS